MTPASHAARCVDATALARMRELSPDYLRRFLAYAESLQWLEQAREQLPKPQAKAARPPRRARRKA